VNVPQPSALTAVPAQTQIAYQWALSTLNWAKSGKPEFEPRLIPAPSHQESSLQSEIVWSTGALSKPPARL